MALGTGLPSPHAPGREEPGGPGVSEAGLLVTQLPSPSLLPTLGSQPRPDPSALGAAVNSWVPAMWDHWEGALWIPPSRNFGRIRDKPCPRASEKCSCQTAGMPAHHSLSFRLSQEVPSGMGMWVLLLGSVLTHYCCRDAEQECVCVCVPCSDSSATPSFPSQPEGKIGLPRANPRGRLRSPS